MGFRKAVLDKRAAAWQRSWCTAFVLRLRLRKKQWQHKNYAGHILVPSAGILQETRVRRHLAHRGLPTRKHITYLAYQRAINLRLHNNQQKRFANSAERFFILLISDIFLAYSKTKHV